MAIFVDDIMCGAVREIRRRSRIKAASRWMPADATVSSVNIRDTFEPRVQVSYRYELDGETHYGVAISVPIDRSAIEQFRKRTETLSALRIRYDLADPLESRVLNGDNPALPFEVDHIPN
jgi:hypothetical protein